MPLNHSRSSAAFKENVRTLMGEVGKSPHVKTPQQALAISYAIKRGRADGGVAGGDVPVDENDTALARDRAASTKSAFDAGRYYMDASGNMQIKPPTPPPPKRASGGGLAGGGPPADSAPWWERNEARGMHVGPVLSAVAGRTDHIATSVPSGSYVLPADHLSALGQGNTTHGFAVVNNLFKPGGPYGSGRTMPIRHGSFPRAPSIKFANGGADSGGARGEGIGQPVEVNIAGGEQVLSPDQVMAVGRKIAADLGMKNASPQKLLKLGHSALDKWVVNTRKKHVATLKRLPPPAKS